MNNEAMRKKCDEPFFDVCKECNRETTGKCIAEKEYMTRVISKLDTEERLFLLWMFAKARGADKLDADEFAAAIEKARKEVA